MPAYNAGKYITAAVDSVTKQSYQNWELIIINDGSTDNTADELLKINDPRVRTHYQANKGQCAAANKAFGLSKGALIKFMDADDLLSPHFLKHQVDRIGKQEDVIISAAWGRFYHDDTSTFKPDENIIRRDQASMEWLVAAMDKKQVMLQCAIWLIPRAVLDRSGLWNEKLSLINDFEFIIRVILTAKQVLFAEHATLYYRSGLHSSLSGLSSRAGAESAFDSISQGTDHMLRHEDTPRIRRIAANCLQNYVYSFYPSHPDLVQAAEMRLKELGGSTAPFPAGGYTKILVFLLGWKLTKRLKILAKK